MKNIFLFTILLLILSFKIDTNIIVDKDEAAKAFNLLNDIRANQSNYETEFPFLKNSKIQNIKLIWNDTLAKVAEAKAYDMASRNYFEHVDPDGFGMNYYINKGGYKLNPEWLVNKSDNVFESISAGTSLATGRSVIKSLIWDNGEPEFGHRVHLLGMDDWSASLVDIGIGFARRDSGSSYKTYVSLIIAKHDW